MIRFTRTPIEAGKCCRHLSEEEDVILRCGFDQERIPVIQVHYFALGQLLGDNVVVVEGPLAEGLPQQGMFNVILINGGVSSIPEGLVNQLAEGGRFVAVLGGESGVGRATLAQRGATGISQRVLFDASIPMLPEFKGEAGFVF